MTRPRLGIVGAGHVAQLNVPGYLEDDRVDVVAVCDPDRERAEQAGRRWDVARVHTDLADLLADDVDAVEILTPTYLHEEHVLAALAAGKHVSCQKPLANDIAGTRRMAAAARRADRILRVSECFFHYPPLVRAKELIAAGAIGAPTMLRMRTVVGIGDSEFAREQGGSTLAWRFDGRSPAGHLFDDMVHKYAVALWLFDQDIVDVQAVVRRAPAFLEAPTAAIFEYERDTLLGTMEVTFAPHMLIRSRYYGADEFFEVQGTDGMLWVTRATGELHDLPPVVVHHGDGTVTSYRDLDADWMAGFRGSAHHFVDALVADDPVGAAPDMTPEMAAKTLQLCFAVYAASNERRPVDPRAIDGPVSPPWWPPDLSHILEDFEGYGK